MSTSKRKRTAADRARARKRWAAIKADPVKAEANRERVRQWRKVRANQERHQEWQRRRHRERMATDPEYREARRAWHEKRRKRLRAAKAEPIAAAVASLNRAPAVPRAPRKLVHIRRGGKWVRVPVGEVPAVTIPPVAKRPDPAADRQWKIIRAADGG